MAGGSASVAVIFLANADAADRVIYTMVAIDIVTVYFNLFQIYWLIDMEVIKAVLIFCPIYALHFFE
jgi:hypothetical protein